MWGTYDVTIETKSIHGTAVGANPGAQTKKFFISKADCEPGAITVTKATGQEGGHTAAGSTLLSTDDKEFAGIDLAPLFTITSTETTCPLRYTVDWLHKHSYQPATNTRTSTTITWTSVQSSGSIFIKNAAGVTNGSDGVSDGVHYFKVTLKSMANQDITGIDSLITITKTSDQCEKNNDVASVGAITD